MTDPTDHRPTRADLGRALFDAAHGSDTLDPYAHAIGETIARFAPPTAAPETPPRTPAIDRAVRRALDACDAELLRHLADRGVLTPAERSELEGIELEVTL